jgi:hypothetical protein
MNNAPNEAEREAIGFNKGLREAPLLQRVGSVDFAQSVPWDWMHLLLENICPLLVDHWMGRFKNLDAGSENYVIPAVVWEEIGAETANAVKTIPAAFVCVLPDIAKERTFFTAESWCFWFLYLAPALLKGHFQNAKYHQHLCDLVKIMKLSLQFSITHEEIDNLEVKIFAWVQTYEKYKVIVFGQSCMLINFYQVLLPIQAKPAQCLPYHNSWLASHPAEHLPVWTNMDNLDISHGALLWVITGCTSFSESTMGQPQQSCHTTGIFRPTSCTV